MTAHIPFGIFSRVSSEEADYPEMEQYYGDKFIEVVQVGGGKRWYQEWGFPDGSEFGGYNANVLIEGSYAEVDEGFLPSEKGSEWIDPDTDTGPIKVEIVVLEDK